MIRRANAFGLFKLNLILTKGSRHSSYTSHASRMSYTSHGDLLGGLGSNGKVMTKENQLRIRSMRNGPASATNNFTEFLHKPAHRGDYVSSVSTQHHSFTMYPVQDGPTGQLCEGKLKHLDNPFIDNSQRQTVVDMKGNSH